MHGVNMVYKRPPYKPSETGFGDDDARFLAREGYNTVRLGIIYKGVEPQPGRYDDKYLADIERTVDTLARHRIFSLLDFHQDLYNERFEARAGRTGRCRTMGCPTSPNSASRTTMS
jgi:endoglycosylceramidase